MRPVSGIAASLLLLASPASSQPAPLPPHAALQPNGLHAYADAESVAAGETIRFHVSAHVPYKFGVAKLGLKVDDRDSDEFIFESPDDHPAQPQPIHPGSYIHVGQGIPASEAIQALTLECWVRPWNLKRWQGLITQHDYPGNCGYGLFIDGRGQVAFALGTGGEYAQDQMLYGPKLQIRQWHHLVAVFDGRTKQIWVDGKLETESRLTPNAAPRKAGPAPLRLGAYGADGKAFNFLDGDIAAPAVYTRALLKSEIANRFKDRALIPPSPNGLFAHWPLDEEKGARIRDASGHQRHGRIINHGTWMIGGPSFDAAQVPRYGGSYDPAKDENRGHALRLAADDLYDCRWDVSHEFAVPRTAKSGIYAAWFEFELNDTSHRYPVTFIVRRANDAQKAPIAMLTSTTTWRAYSGAWFARNIPRDDRFWPTGGPASDPAGAPSYNCYKDHRSGQPTYQVGLRLPWPAAGPDVRYSQPDINYSHLMRAERFTHVWLEKEGYEFDVITSLDLHRDPTLLDGYQSLIINGHDEYWSIEMYENLDRYLRSGGNVAVLSGNTMFWRVSFNDDLSIMECRKYGPAIGGRKLAQVGEIYHSHDGKRGSLMRHAGYPAYEVIGMECSGWWGGSNNGVYTVSNEEHFLFNTPEKIDWSDRKTFAHGAKGSFPRAGGHEGDVRLSSFAKPKEAIPQNGVIPREPDGIQTIAKIERKNSRAQDYFARWVNVPEATLVDMIYWERPQGGKVFHAGAIAFGWTLAADPKQAALMRNVLHHFGVKPTQPERAKKPNIVFILTDNQGAWQLGCYGNPDFQTPHIDRMAREGVRFTRAYANNAVCSPTRATYLTGLTPSQHGVHRYLSAGRLQIGSQAKYTLEEFTTLPEVLHHAGYTCGLSGKWHLGANATPQDGFSFWVTKEHGHSAGFLKQRVLENGKTKIIDKHLSEYWTDRGIEFIEREAKKDNPFFLYLAYNGPYTLSGAMREKVPSPWSDPYVDHPLPSFPRPAQAHPWQRNQHDLIGDIEAGRNLAGQVTAVDAGVGRIMEALKRLKLDQDTLVIYTADQGAVAGHAGFWGMGDHTKPLHGRDGTMHIPMIFRWPGQITANRVEDRLVSNYDFMPSLLGLLGLPMPTQPSLSPGRDFSGTLRGRDLKTWDDEVFYEFENVRAIRTLDWKYVERLAEEPYFELYDLKADPDELRNLATAKERKPRKDELANRLHAWFEKHTDPKWDLWKGGKSKSRIGTAPQFRAALGPDAGRIEPPLRPATKPQSTQPSSFNRPGREISPEKDHSLKLPAEAAYLAGGSVKINDRVKAIAWWKTTKDTALWKLRNIKPGKYTVVLEWAAPDSCAGQEFLIANQSRSIQFRSKVVSTGGWGKFLAKSIGEIELPHTSVNLSLNPTIDIKAEDLFDLRGILLLPEGSSEIQKYQKARPASAAVELAPRKPLSGNSPEAVASSQNGSFTLTANTASIHGPDAEIIQPHNAIAGWTKPSHPASWRLTNITPGKYDVHVDWAMPDVSRSGLQSARLSLDGNTLRVAPIRTTGGADRYASFIIGTIDLPAGDHDFAFAPNGNVASTWVRLRSMRLVPADTGEFQIPPLAVPEGFEIAPAAIPPLVKHPMMACLDDRGRMFISESAGINAKAPELLEKRPHKILMLEDKDNDGVYDQSTVFAENLVLPNGAQWLDGSLYVCSPPYVWKLTDTDGDGNADKQTPVNGKFGFNGMSSAFHGPVLGPDGRLYWCGGQHGWTLGDTSPGFDLNGPWTSRAPGVFSSWPDGSDTENRAHGGLANPVEVTFSAEGEVFGTVAVYDGVNGRHDAVLHWMHGAKYNLNRSRGTDLPQTSYPILPPVSRRGWVAPPGLTRYRSGAFGEEYKDDIFLCEFNTHRVYRLQLERQGASFSSTDQVFLESSSPYTHFTDVFEDADGSLLVVDTGGWFLYGCPTSSIEKPEIRGAIYRIKRKNQKSPADPRGSKIDWAKQDATQLGSLLDDTRFIVRDKAVAQLAKRGRSVVPELAQVLTNSPSARARRNAVWTLTRIDSLAARDAVRPALRDNSLTVQLSATRSVSTRRDTNAFMVLNDLVVTGKPPVRREAATVLGRIGHSSAIPALLKSLDTAREDRFLQHALTYALIEIGDPAPLRTGLLASSAAAQQGALIALDEMENGGLKPRDLSLALSSEDATLRGHAIRIATKRKWAAPVTQHLENKLAAATEQSRPALRDALVSFTHDPAIQQMISDALDDRELPSAARRALLDVIAQTRLKKIPERWSQEIFHALESESPMTLLPAIAAAHRWKSAAARPKLIEIARNSKMGANVRLAALAAFPVRNELLPDDIFAFLLKELDSSNLPGQRTAAARIISSSQPSAKQRASLLPALTRSGPLEFAGLLSAFQADNESSSGVSLMRAISQAPARSSLTPEQVQRIAGRYNNGKVTRMAQPIMRELEASTSNRETRLAELEAELRLGNPDRGMAAFAKAACNVCHQVQGSGGVIGPDLSQIGGIRTTRDLLEAIVYPNASFAREYEPMTVNLKDGESLSGRISGEENNFVHLMNVAGEILRIERKKIQSIETSTTSLMPAGLEQALTSEELSDLIAYLRGLK